MKLTHKGGDAMMRKFFRKHIRLAQFLCPHDSSNDIGTLTTYDGKQRIVSQCRYCGLIIVATKRFREPNDELIVPFLGN